MQKPTKHKIQKKYYEKYLETKENCLYNIFRFLHFAYVFVHFAISVQPAVEFPSYSVMIYGTRMQMEGEKEELSCPGTVGWKWKGVALNS